MCVCAELCSLCQCINDLLALWQALKANPSHNYNLHNYAQFLAEVRSQYVEAATLFERALKSKPNDVDTMLQLAVLLYKKFQAWERSEELFKTALRVEPDNALLQRHYNLFRQRLEDGGPALVQGGAGGGGDGAGGGAGAS